MTDIISPDAVKQITLDEHDGISTPTKKVSDYGWDPVGLQKVRKKVGGQGQTDIDEERYTTAIAYDASNNPIYVGEALEGTAKSAASWRIKKLTWDANGNCTDLQWADGNDNFDNIWDNRTTYSYS